MALNWRRNEQNGNGYPANNMATTDEPWKFPGREDEDEWKCPLHFGEKGGLKL